jgi:hypothetical protein
MIGQACRAQWCATTLRKIAEALSARGVATSRGLQRIVREPSKPRVSRNIEPNSHFLLPKVLRNKFVMEGSDLDDYHARISPRMTAASSSR